VIIAWFLVVVAGVFEMGFAVLLKQSHLKLVSISLVLADVIGLNLAGVTPP
jgi:multidrug transporter EmrE-like cation transporter